MARNMSVTFFINLSGGAQIQEVVDVDALPRPGDFVKGFNQDLELRVFTVKSVVHDYKWKSEPKINVFVEE